MLGVFSLRFPTLETRSGFAYSWSSALHCRSLLPLWVLWVFVHCGTTSSSPSSSLSSPFSSSSSSSSSHSSHYCCFFFFFFSSVSPSFFIFFCCFFLAPPHHLTLLCFRALFCFIFPTFLSLFSWILLIL